MCCNFFFPSVAFKKLFCRSVIYHNKKGWKYSRHVKIEIPVDHLRETVNAIVTDLGVYLTLFMHCLRFSTRLPTLGCFLIPSYCLHDQAPVDPTGFIHTESWSLWLLPQIQMQMKDHATEYEIFFIYKVQERPSDWKA